MWLPSLWLSLSLGTAPDAADLVELHWTAPAGCPSGDAVNAAIAALVVDNPRSDAVRPRVDAEVVAADDHWALRLRLSSAHGERVRELRARRCDALVDAVAMETALLIEAEQARAAATPSPTPVEPIVPPTGVAPPAIDPVRARPIARRRSPRWRLRAGMLAGGTVIEDSFVAPTLGAMAVGRRWSAGLDLAYWPRGFVALPGRVLEGARMALSTATFAGCGRVSRARFGASGCGGIELGIFTARGIGLSRAQSVVEPSAALVFSPGLEIVLGSRLLASVAPWVRLALRRPGIRVDGVGELARSRFWAFGAALRLEIEIGGRKPGRRGIRS